MNSILFNEIKNNIYWRYNAADIYIPALDNVNTILLEKSDSGYFISATEVHSEMKPFTIQEYRDRFCKYDEETNKWFYYGMNK